MHKGIKLGIIVVSLLALSITAESFLYKSTERNDYFERKEQWQIVRTRKYAHCKACIGNFRHRVELQRVSRLYNSEGRQDKFHGWSHFRLRTFYEQRMQNESTTRGPLPKDLTEALYTACTEYGVPVYIALAVIEQESNFDVSAIGPDGKDIGLFQIRKSNHEWLQSETEADPMEPTGNIECGVWLLSYLFARYDTADAALTAYRFGHDNGDRQYANQVLARAEAYK